MAGNCQRVTIVKPKKCALGVCEKRTSEGTVAVREDSEKLSGWFLIHRQTGSEGVAGGGAKFLPTGQPRVTQPWLNRSLISCSVACHRAGRFMPIVNRRPRTKKSSRRGDQGGILGQATKGAVASLGCLHAVTSYVECQAWDFHRRFFIFPSMGATTEKKKDAPVSRFGAPSGAPR